MREAQKPLSSSRYAMSSSESDSAEGEEVAVKNRSGENQCGGSQRLCNVPPPSSLCLYQPNFFIIFFFAIAAPFSMNNSGMNEYQAPKRSGFAWFVCD